MNNMTSIHFQISVLSPSSFTMIWNLNSYGGPSKKDTVCKKLHEISSPTS